MASALLVILVALGAAAADTPKLPKTTPGKRVTSLLAALNSGEPLLIRQFIETEFAPNALKEGPAAERVPAYLHLYGDTGGFDLRKVEDSSDHSLTVLLETRKTGEWYRLACTVDMASPHGIRNLTIRWIPRPAEFGGKGKLTDPQMAAELDRYLRKLAAGGMFSGVVVFAKNGNALLEKAIAPGTAKTPYDVNTRFPLGPIGKVFTAVAVAQLQEKKELGFLDRISRYLPEFPRPRGDSITIQQLLTHTAGMEPFLDRKSFDDLRSANVTTVGDLERFLGSRPAAAPPGERFIYSNADYMLLDIIVQRVSGEPMSAYLQRHIFAPAGMTNTGNGESTAADLTRFATALLHGDLLPPEATKFLMGGRVATPDPDVMFAHGLEDETCRGIRIVGLAAAGPNLSNQLDMYPGLGYTLVGLSPQPGGAAGHVARKVREMISQP